MSSDAETEAEALRIFKADAAEVNDLLHKIMTLTRIQVIRDSITSPDCSYELLNRFLQAKHESDRTMNRYIVRLVMLLVKLRSDGHSIEMTMRHLQLIELSSNSRRVSRSRSPDHCRPGSWTQYVSSTSESKASTGCSSQTSKHLNR